MGAWQEIVDYTVPSNTTSVVLNSFGTITKDDFVKVVFTQVAGTSNANVRWFPNTTSGVSGYNTNTNYYRQELQGYDTLVSAARVNTAELTFAAANNTNYSLAYIKLSENGAFNVFSNQFRTLDSSLFNRFRYLTSSGLDFSAGITSLTLTTADGTIATGSRIQIYKLAAEKVADITVGSNTSQVDISNLSIDKDSEYLLVSDTASGNGSGNLYLTPNDLTTQSNYYNQRIIAYSSTSTASRDNTSRIFQISNPGGTMAYTHIKLSNIGAFTAQSYSLFAQGSIQPFVINYFVSSVAENITSITKLNLISALANDIKAGSRFTLYKLY